MLASRCPGGERGWGLCSHYGSCHGLGRGTPGRRASFYHFVEVSLEESGAISGRVIRAFEGTQDDPAHAFRA